MHDNMPRNHPNLMPVELINKMASDLIRMCDSIDNHGLVDYQYGVAEEQILDSTSTKDPAPETWS